MLHGDLCTLFIQILTMLVVGLVFGQIAHRGLRQPIVTGEILGGILLGPTLFGLVLPEAYAWVFPPDRPLTPPRDAIIKLGMLFFLFVAGLQVNLVHLKHNGLSFVLISLFGIVVPFALGAASVRLFPGLWGPSTGLSTDLFAMFVGTALSISALPVIARILIDLGLMYDEVGVLITGAAMINDLIGWSLFAIILSAFMPSATPMAGSSVWIYVLLVFGFSALVIGFGRWVGGVVVRRMQTYLRPANMMTLYAIFLLAVAAAAEALHIHSTLGAFMAGVALSQGMPKTDDRLHNSVFQFAVGFFAPIYFVSIGLKVDFYSSFDLPLVLLVLLIATMGKVCGAGLGAWLGGLPMRLALAIGFGMNARGAMEVILATVALEQGLINDRVFVALVVMALVTTMLSGPMMQWLLRLGYPGAVREAAGLAATRMIRVNRNR